MGNDLEHGLQHNSKVGIAVDNPLLSVRNVKVATPPFSLSAGPYQIDSCS